MCTAALQQELNGQIAGLSNENVRLLIEVAKSMRPSAASVSGTSDSNHAGVVSPRALGALKGSLVYMADDFDETPSASRSTCEAGGGRAR